MADEKIPSNLGKLNIHDLFSGLIMAVGAPALTYLQSIIPNYNLPTFVQLSIGALITYLLKNVFTDNIKVAQKVLTKATEKAETGAQVQSIVNPVLEAGAQKMS